MNINVGCEVLRNTMYRGSDTECYSVVLRVF